MAVQSSGPTLADSHIGTRRKAGLDLMFTEVGYNDAESLVGLLPVIRRDLLEGPAWRTAYIPYRQEISQRRLEACRAGGARVQLDLRELTARTGITADDRNLVISRPWQIS
jgi:glycine cleavage system protein